MPSRYNLFVSHRWSHDGTYHGLLQLLDRAPAFPYRNYSVPQHYSWPEDTPEDVLVEGLRRQIRYSSCVVVCAGVNATYSDWIELELAIAAEEFGKPIVGVKPHGAKRVSGLVRDYADEIVGWRKASIEGAIRDYCG
ncbi:MAG: TIR domain-containing protein [Myxococcota bacterium]